MSSSGYLRLIYKLKIPKIPLHNLQNSYLDVGLIIQLTLATYIEPAKLQAHPRQVHWPTVSSPTDCLDGSWF